ncbi:UTP--glucose-1-phosphate uridylyltransferase [Auriculariales sp. MPI-PUGE-AT-0066]|nr:UTP--glucose-1-phosphate uridylyltransferase [Auriculariales sp. MPI-PUGE-AT-0066]
MATLAPPADKEPRVRGHSTMDFKSAATGITAKNMRNELNRMVSEVSNPEEKRAFTAQMDGFFNLYSRYLADKAKSEKLDWEKVKSPAKDQIVNYADLPEAGSSATILDKVAVLKLNGGLGTTMGMGGAPKSAIEVREGMTFLDLSVRQIEHLNEKYKTNVFFILMNSFNTDEETQRIIQKYSNHNVRIITFNQSRYPRVGKDSQLPIPRSARSDKSQWYPPGHGDLFDAMRNSGLLDNLLAAGKEYVFVSNVDNLGADVDLKILKHLEDSQAEFLMELTDKTKADVKGGTIIDYDGQVRLLEIAQVPSEHVEDFKSVRKFAYFNTNSVYINLKAMKRVLEEGSLDLEIIVNPKVSDDGTPVIQLETAVGAAIKHFKNAHGINVPRSRFLPVKSSSDLLLITSDLYSLEHGKLIMSPKRMFQARRPLSSWATISRSWPTSRNGAPFLVLPYGAAHAGAGSLDGVRRRLVRPQHHPARTVIIVANEGSKIDLPDGTILDNKLVSGNVSIIDH